MMDTQKFFDKKKREFSNQFNEGEESRKQSQTSLDDSIANVTSSNVFTETLKSEDFSCVAILQIVDNTTFLLRNEKSTLELINIFKYVFLFFWS